jgi:hypothetical protein
MKKFIIATVAVGVISGGIWLLSFNPQANAHLRTEANTIKMDIEQMTRKSRNLPVTVVDNFM